MELIGLVLNAVLVVIGIFISIILIVRIKGERKEKQKKEARNRRLAALVRDTEVQDSINEVIERENRLYSRFKEELENKSLAEKSQEALYKTYARDYDEFMGLWKEFSESYNILLKSVDELYGDMLEEDNLPSCGYERYINCFRIFCEYKSSLDIYKTRILEFENCLADVRKSAGSKKSAEKRENAIAALEITHRLVVNLIFARETLDKVIASEESLINNSDTKIYTENLFFAFTNVYEAHEVLIGAYSELMPFLKEIQRKYTGLKGDSKNIDKAGKSEVAVGIARDSKISSNKSSDKLSKKDKKEAKKETKKNKASSDNKKDSSKELKDKEEFSDNDYDKADFAEESGDDYPDNDYNDEKK